MRSVPYEGRNDAPILLVGEAPGADEEAEGRPFIGVSGRLLRQCLERAGVTITTDVMFANLYDQRPKNNKLESVLESPEFGQSLGRLHAHIKQFRPKVIGALGNYPLYFLTGHKGIRNYRGSILPYKYDDSIKVVACYHPAYIVRVPGTYPIFDQDVKRIVGEVGIEGLQYPDYNINVATGSLEQRMLVEELSRVEKLAVDIETVKNTSRILCVGFSDNESRAFVVPTNNASDLNVVSEILSNQAVKCFHNGMFDTAMLLRNGVTVNNYAFDTIIAAHALYPELPRSLAHLASIYTRQIYYKGEGRSNIPSEDAKGDADSKGWSDKFDRGKLYTYNGTDCCVTFKVWNEIEKELEANPRAKATFDFEMSMIPVADSISQAGQLVDEERRFQIQVMLQRKWGKLQMILNGLTGYECNVYSTKVLPNILYEKLGLPAKRTREGRITADEDAIVSLIAFCKAKVEEYKTEEKKKEWRVKTAICETIIKVRGIRKLLSTYILAKRSEDGRIRGSYRVDGTETGRWSCKKFIDGTGLNMQTIPRDAYEISEEDLKTAKEMQLSELGGENEGENTED